MLLRPLNALPSICSNCGSGQICGQKSALKIDVVNCVSTFHIKRPPRVRYCNSSSTICQDLSQINFCTAVSKDKPRSNHIKSMRINNYYLYSLFFCCPLDFHISIWYNKFKKWTVILYKHVGGVNSYQVHFFFYPLDIYKKLVYNGRVIRGRPHFWPALAKSVKKRLLIQPLVLSCHFNKFVICYSFAAMSPRLSRWAVTTDQRSAIYFFLLLDFF